MKKAKILAAALFTAILLAGCQCRHEWVEADCTTPKTCAKCGETEGEALGHEWVEADCTTPKTCTRCGETEGEALGHNWVGATYQSPGTCSRCNAEGSKLIPYFQEMGWECAIFFSNESKSEENPAGSVQINEITRFSSDKSHPAMDGYEWLKVNVYVSLSPKEKENHTGLEYFTYEDYYVDINSQESSDTFCVNWQGVDYDACTVEYEQKSAKWVFQIRVKSDGTEEALGKFWDREEILYFRIPVGYDGIVLCYGALTPEEQEKYNSETRAVTAADMVDGNVVLLRIDDNMTAMVTKYM